MVTVILPKSDSSSWRTSPANIEYNGTYDSFKNNKKNARRYRKNCVCGVCIISEDGEYFLMVYQNHAGKWSFPKGSKEFGETNFFCMKRELYEETGININELKYTFLYKIRRYQYSLSIIQLKENYKSIVLNPRDTEEIGQAKWVKINDALKLNLNRVTEDVVFDLKNKNIFQTEDSTSDI